MSIFSSYKKIFLLGFIIVILIAIPLSVYVAQQRQRTTTKAAASTILSFEPASSTAKVGDTLVLNIMLDPGVGSSANQVSFAKLSISFDSSKFTTVSDSLAPNPTSPNTLTFVLEDPVYTSGKATMSLSIGADPTRVVTTKTKIAILKLKATNETNSTSPNVTFDSAPSTQVLSIASSDQTSENVLSTTIPATVTIASASTTSSTSPTIGKAPTCSNLNVDRSTTGTAPYSLTFTAIGSDSDGTISKVSFNFGDGPIQVLTSGGGIGTSSIISQISHTYNNPANYTAYAILTDNNNNLSAQQESCTKTITVNPAQIAGTTGSGIGTIGTTGAQLTPIVITQAPQDFQIIQPLPTGVTLPPTGPGEKILGIGILGVIFTIIGGALLILL